MATRLISALSSRVVRVPVSAVSRAAARHNYAMLAKQTIIPALCTVATKEGSIRCLTTGTRHGRTKKESSHESQVMAPPTYEIIDVEIEEFGHQTNCVFNELEEALTDMFAGNKLGEADNYFVKKGGHNVHINLGPHGHFEVERDIDRRMLVLRSETKVITGERFYKYDPISREWIEVKGREDATAVAGAPLLNFLANGLSACAPKK